MMALISVKMWEISCVKISGKFPIIYKRFKFIIIQIIIHIIKIFRILYLFTYCSPQIASLYCYLGELDVVYNFFSDALPFLLNK